MKQIRKRSWALALALAMILSLFTGISARAEGEDKTGLAIAGVRWEENNPNPFFGNDDWFNKEYDIAIYDDNHISLGEIKGADDVSKIKDFSKIHILDSNNNVIDDENIAYISDSEMRWDEEQRQDVPVKLTSGIYKLRINALGTYKIVYDDLPGDSVTVNVTLPEFAVCSTDEMTPDTILANPWRDLFYTPGKSYYLVANPDIANMGWIKGMRVNLHGVIGGGTIDWKEDGYSPIEISIPEDFSDSIGDDFIEVFVRYDNDNEDRKCIRANCSQDGLIIADTEWRYDDVIKEERNCPRDINDEGRFGKGFGIGIYYNSPITLVLNKDGVRSYLTKTDLNKLSILDESGAAVTDPDIAQIKMDRYGYNKNANNPDAPWEWIEEDSKDVFTLLIHKSGKYFLKYTDGDYSSSVVIYADVPDMAIYGKKKISESYILGGDEVEYNDSRKTYYILFNDIEDEFYTEDLTITGIRYMEGDIENISVKTDKANDVVIVSISDEAIANADEFGINVSFKRIKTWYHFDEETGEKVLDTSDDPNYRNPLDEPDNRWFRFRPAEDVRAYSEEAKADVDAAEAAEKLVAELPDVREITVDNEDAIKAARDAYEGLSPAQKEIYSDSKLSKLQKCEEALDAAKAAKQEADKKAAEDAKKIADEKAAAVEAAKKDSETEAAKKAAEAAKKAAEDKEAAVNAAKKEADDKAAEAAKKAEDEKAAAVEAAKKADLPAAGDEICDKASKCVYAVIKASDGTSEGTVECVGPTKKTAKVVIPESITYNGIKYTVVSIGAEAFMDSKKITSVTIPVTVTSIGAKAFNGCAKLKTINIYGKNLKSVNKTAFKGIKKKAKFTIYVADKKTFNTIKKWIKKSKPKSAKYTMKTSK